MTYTMYAFTVWVLTVCAIIAAAEIQTIQDIEAKSIEYPEEFVNILGGTDSRYDLSHGSTLPLLAVPWGFNHYTIQTDDDPTWPGWFFHPTDRRFFGLRVTHQPSPWISDYGNFIIKALIPSSISPNADTYTSYSTSQSTFTPYYFKTNLFSYTNGHENLLLEFTPSTHSGILRVTFPSYVSPTIDGNAFIQTRRLLIQLNGGSDSSDVTITGSHDDTVMLSGFTKVNSGGVGDDNAAFAHYFVALLYYGIDGNVPIPSSDVIVQKATNECVYVDLLPYNEHRSNVVTVRFATSFISVDQALANMLREIPAATTTFDSVRTETKSIWNTLLSRIQIPAIGGVYTTVAEVNDAYTMFYSALYRSSLFPRLLEEYVDGDKSVHWSPYATSADTRVMSGSLSTDSGFWDAHHSVYPLLTLYAPSQLGVILQGWVNAYREGGWVPKWASPGYRSGMVGTMADVVISDAIVNSIPGFDVTDAFEGILKNAYSVPPEGVEGVGRVCLEGYLQYGYIAKGSPMTTGGDCTEIVSRSLNYMQSDWAISQAAKRLGYDDISVELLHRSMNYTDLFDAEIGLFRSRVVVTEKFSEPFDQYEWGGDYTEGGPIQYRFYVPWDVKGLADLYKSSNRDMCSEISNTQTRNGAYHAGSYDNPIHEQTEMVDHCWGQYCHNNQPVHHMLYTYMYQGLNNKQCASQGQYYIRRVLTDLYKPTCDMFPGDEDNGEMSSWFVLSALGLYNFSPGSGTYVLGTPLYGKVTIDITTDGDADTQRYITIEARNNSRDNVYVESVYWNGVEITDGRIAYSDLRAGGTLLFNMSPSPV